MVPQHAVPSQELFPYTAQKPTRVACFFGVKSFALRHFRTPAHLIKESSITEVSLLCEIHKDTLSTTGVYELQVATGINKDVRNS
jgi:hypothetical protein